MVKKGNYVLATKYIDGDPMDQWAVGFYSQQLDYSPVPRHEVVNKDGVPFRNDGFRRAENITSEEGEFLIKAMQTGSSVKLWALLRKSCRNYSF